MEGGTRVPVMESRCHTHGAGSDRDGIMNWKPLTAGFLLAASLALAEDPSATNVVVHDVRDLTRRMSDFAGP